MTEIKKAEAGPPKGGSRIESYIGGVKKALRRDNSSLMAMDKSKKADYQLYEYTHATVRATLAARYVFLLIGLGVLYLVKAVWWPFHRREPAADKT